MAGILGVDIEVLGKTVQSLRGAEQVLNDAMTAMTRDGHGDIGTTVLNDAADSFQRRWHFGIERIGESAKVTAEGVSKCHDAYQDVDTAIAKALDQVTAAIDGKTQAEA
ncbi:hypothetical protein F3087_23930 [Nocardia colli]|uniref:Uncharacterized protein n=1 Tax=Nocardia colli TaxID=2545717 RepID=A0A5N0EAS6_9NOCA|nr:hypothetical protein [Nocardia colli]KAA8886522.1 hypothetical protein F3087_23930 [Nocardia colli]